MSINQFLCLILALNVLNALHTVHTLNVNVHTEHTVPTMGRGNGVALHPKGFSNRRNWPSAHLIAAIRWKMSAYKHSEETMHLTFRLISESREIFSALI